MLNSNEMQLDLGEVSETRDELTLDKETLKDLDVLGDQDPIGGIYSGPTCVASGGTVANCVVRQSVQ